ncbi:unnamed protein product [Fraxinus pennsylvanica]|uniref:AP2/ERF domain-containing protein n=1 Tax=Fraxinus pennsylvanica TaxID=56036 RepID=A0AAD1YUJ7_9LAMI|nr:unnamed protein product [Fraxinus pennsylvanica]
MRGSGEVNGVHYRGVRMMRCGKYVAEIRNPATKSTIWVGTYYTAVDAARVYDSAARRFHGAKSKNNFPTRRFHGTMQSFVHNENNNTHVESSPLDLTLAPMRNFPVEFCRQKRQFTAAPSHSRPTRFEIPPAAPQLGLHLSLSLISRGYGELQRIRAVEARRNALDLDLNRPPPEEVWRQWGLALK